MKNILLVEDDPFLIDIYGTKFEEAGFSVIPAKSGKEVFIELENKKIDLVILDVVLPGIDGWAVLERIKKEEKFKNIPVIILSNLGQRSDVEKGLKLGAAKYLIKAHYTPSMVVEKIKELFENNE